MKNLIKYFFIVSCSLFVLNLPNYIGNPAPTCTTCLIIYLAFSWVILLNCMGFLPNIDPFSTWKTLCNHTSPFVSLICVFIHHSHTYSMPMIFLLICIIYKYFCIVYQLNLYWNMQFQLYWLFLFYPNTIICSYIFWEIWKQLPLLFYLL